jgi:glycosyltransferase involved in cell wall biosynthesis
MLSDLAFAMASDDWRVWVVTSRQMYEDPQAMLPARENQGGVEIRRVWTTRFGRANLVGRAVDYASFYAATLWTLLRITHRGDVIVAKTDPPLISIIAWIAARVKGARLINWLQDVFPEVAQALGVLTWRPLVTPIRWMRNLSLRGATMNVVLGEQMRRHVCMQGVVREKTTVIHNWVDGSRIYPVPQASNSLRKMWNLEDKFVIGYSGNMGRAHEFNTIIGAMQRLHDDKNVIFLFIGGGSGKQILELAVNEAGLRNFLFLPYQPKERLSESLSVPDVHLVSLQPALEGLIVPSKFYGIAAAGRPVIFIGDPEGELGGLVSKFHMGFTIEVGAVNELVRRLEELRNQPEVAVRMGANSRRCLEDNFDKHIAIRAWSSLLRQYGAMGTAHPV